jgi:hypothetical protein
MSKSLSMREELGEGIRDETVVWHGIARRRRWGYMGFFDYVAAYWIRLYQYIYNLIHMCCEMVGTAGHEVQCSHVSIGD